jgi:hypothetical protein
MKSRFVILIAIVGVGLLALVPRPALAHCDTLDGPVVKDARVALDSNDVKPVLKWISADKENEIRDALRRAVAVRALGAEARALADRFFFETLVRVHREGEGEPYTGLKPAGTEIDPGIVASDKALETGSVDPLARMLVAKVEQGLRDRYARAAEARTHASESIEKGREYVAAYVAFMHHVEGLYASAAGGPAHAAHWAGQETTRPKAHAH